MIHYNERLPRTDTADTMTPAELRAYRLEVLGMTQATLAVALGVQPLSVSRWELGRSPVPSWLRYALLGLATTCTKGQ